MSRTPNLSSHQAQRQQAKKGEKKKTEKNTRVSHEFTTERQSNLRRSRDEIIVIHHTNPWRNVTQDLHHVLQTEFRLTFKNKIRIKTKQRIQIFINLEFLTWTDPWSILTLR
jgi:hypothetical protein